MGRDLKFRNYEVEEMYCVAQTKAMLGCADTAQLICACVFAFAKNRFSNDAAHLTRIVKYNYLPKYPKAISHVIANAV